MGPVVQNPEWVRTIKTKIKPCNEMINQALKLIDY